MCDVSTRVQLYLEETTRTLLHYLYPYKLAYYSKKQLKKFPRVQSAVQMWQYMTQNVTWSPRYAHWIMEALPVRKRDLWRHIADLFELDLGDDFVPDQLLQRRAKQLAFPKHLHVRTRHLKPRSPKSKMPLKDGAKHGQGCCTFEIFFDQHYREEHNL